MNRDEKAPPSVRALALIGPGILVAATGVGTGDLVTGALAGARVGPALLWAVVVGAVFKFLLTEGLARWQLATGQTLLEGAVARIGPVVRYGFLVYLLIWSYYVGSALMGACGATAHALVPLGFAGDPVSAARWDKILYGIVHSLIAVVLVRRGGYRLFEKTMSVCIALMFVTVVVTAGLLRPDWPVLLRGLFVPTIPGSGEDPLNWTVAVIGGVGGTLTVLCYGYWIREERREGLSALRTCRIDLSAGYTMTALFGIAMVVIGSRVSAEGRGVTLLVEIARELETELGIMGPAARWAFLIGAWGAVFSSLLGVWQSVPYLFADFWNMPRSLEGGKSPAVDTGSLPYRGYLYTLASVPAVGLFFDFAEMQKLYAIVGALFVPLLAGVLLVLNNRTAWVGPRARSSIAINLGLAASLVFFVLYGVVKLREALFGS